MVYCQSCQKKFKWYSFEKSLIRENDLLLTKSSGSSLHIGKTTLADAYFEEHECYYSNFLQRLSLKRTVFPKLYWYIFNSIFVREQFVYLQNSTSGIGNINSDNINNVIVPTLPYDMQQKIVAILDVKCEEIDKLIANQQGQIDKLKEYKQSVITEAVTKGLDPSVPMKDSGVEWIGSIPEEWKISSVKSLFNIISGATPKSDIQEYWDGDIIWVTPSDFKTEDVFISQGKRNISLKGLKSCSTTMVPINSIIFSKRAPIGLVAINKNELCTNQGCLSCVNIFEQNIKYFYYVMSICTEQFNLLGSGTTFKEISATKFSLFSLPQPSVAEQQQIADYLDDKCGKIDQLIAIKQQKIDKLQQYKKSLIYEYVTGKKEVV